MRTEALVKSLEVNAVDDATLIGLLILALNARNVSIQTHGSGHATRTKLVQSITEGGRLSHDVERLRVVARQTLANVLSCSLGHGDSGLPARIAGDAIGADAHLGNMATEEFLSCLSKTAIERVRIEPERPATPARQGHPRRRRRRSRRLDLHPPRSAVRPLPSRNRPPLGSPARLFVGLRRRPTMHRTRRPRKRMEPLARRMIPSSQSRTTISTTWTRTRTRISTTKIRRSSRSALALRAATGRRPSSGNNSSPSSGARAPQPGARARTGVFAHERRRPHRLRRRQAPFRIHAPAASMRDLIDEAFRRGYELDRSVRLPAAARPASKQNRHQEARHGRADDHSRSRPP